VIVERDAVVEHSVVFDNVFIEPGARIRRAILDKECRVCAGASIGHNYEADKARGFTISENGITVVPKGTIVNRVEPSLL
jgi:glucose-1-phosphate adenylyltransferase